MLVHTVLRQLPRGKLLSEFLQSPLTVVLVVPGASFGVADDEPVTRVLGAFMEHALLLLQ